MALSAAIHAFTVQLSHVLGAVYQWQRNGASIPGATNASYSLSPVALSDSGSAFGCFIFNAT